MKTDMEDSLRAAVEAFVYEDQPSLIAFDGCHKIYGATSAEQRQWFIDNSVSESDPHGYNIFFSHDEGEMVETLIDWFMDSCPLRFISAVGGTGTNGDFSEVIPQFWEDQFNHYCEDCGVEVDEDEELCADCEWAQDHVPCDECGCDIEPGWGTLCDDCEAEALEDE